LLLLLFDDSSFSSVSITVKEDNNKEEHPSTGRENHQSKMTSTEKKIGFEELCKHNTLEDLWLAIDGIVYDVTPFMDDHPGGGEIMLSAANKDGTDDFEDVGHSPHARELLKKFKVGVFEGEFGDEAPLTKKKKGGRDDVSIGGNAILGMVLPILVLLCAIVAYYMGMQR